jgi:nitroreductase
MEALEAMLTRRSIRRYSDDPVTDDEVAALLRAAMSAPSGFGQRSTRYVVVRDAGTRSRLSQISKYSSMIADAPVAIIVCGDTRAERQPGLNFVHDGIAALENLLVAVTAMGLGAVWVGVHPWPERMETVREVVGLPEGVEPIAAVPIGRPAESPEPIADRYDAASVHTERW